MAIRVEVGWKPIQIDSEAIGVAEIHQGYVPQGSAGEDRLPGDRMRGAGARAAESGVQEFLFGCIHRGMLGGCVAIVPKPDRRPYESQRAECEEGGAPTVSLNDEYDERWSQSGAKAGTGVRNSLGEAALRGHQPTR